MRVSLRQPDHRAIRGAVIRAYREGQTPEVRAQRFLSLYNRILKKYSLFEELTEQGRTLVLEGFATLRTAEDVAHYLIRLASEPQVTFTSKVEQLEKELNVVLALAS